VTGLRQTSPKVGSARTTGSSRPGATSSRPQTGLCCPATGSSGPATTSSRGRGWSADQTSRGYDQGPVLARTREPGLGHRVRTGRLYYTLRCNSALEGRLRPGRWQDDRRRRRPRDHRRMVKEGRSSRLRLRVGFSMRRPTSSARSGRSTSGSTSPGRAASANILLPRDTVAPGKVLTLQ
jgi:hypothetical protein